MTKAPDESRRPFDREEAARQIWVLLTEPPRPAPRITDPDFLNEAAASFRSLLAYQMKYEGRPSSNAPDGPLSDSMTKALEQARADGRLHVGQSPEQRQRVIRECSQRAAELDRQARPMAAGEALDQSLKEASETGRLASGMDQAAYLHGMAQVVSRAVDLLEEASRSRQDART
jgi:hypothetical protein